MLCGFIKVHLSSTSQRSNALWPADYGGGGGGENVLSICKKSGPYLETPPRLEPGEPGEPWGPRTGSPGPVPLPVTVPGRGIWRVNRSKWSSAVRQSVRLGMASATAPPARSPAHYLKPSVCMRVAIAVSSHPHLPQLPSEVCEPHGPDSDHVDGNYNTEYLHVPLK